MATTLSTAPAQTVGRRRGPTIAGWALQVALALLIGGGGIAKLAGDPTMVEMFSDIGVGQWFRYAVGGLEVAGAIGLLLPRLAGRAALGVAALMVGAIVTNLAVLDANPAVPFVLMLVAVLIGWLRRAQLRAMITA